VIDVNIADLDEYLERGGASFDRFELIGEAESVQRPPAFVLGNLPAGLSLPILSEFVTGPVRLYVLKNGCVTFDGIVIHGQTALSSILLNHPDYHVASVVQHGLGGRISLPVRHVAGQAVMLSGPGYTVYGHWLVDILPRFWVMERCGYSIDNLSFVIPVQAPAFVAALLATFGIRPEQIVYYDERAEILEIEELLLPTNLRRASRIQPRFIEARDFLLARRDPARTAALDLASDRIFVSRRNADASRSLLNRERVEALAIAAGFKLVYPEDLSIVDQIDLFAGARQIMGEYGSGLHNSIFAAPGTLTCALRGTSVHPGFIQSGLGHVCDQQTGYIFGGTPLDAIHQSFEVEEIFLNTALKIMSLS
jgi:capsular polysaccharide biosynthesis protein